MGRKKTIYLGGEEDKQSEITPKHFEKFFNKRMLLIVLMIMLLLLVCLL